MQFGTRMNEQWLLSAFQFLDIIPSSIATISNRTGNPMKYLHTMIRVSDLEKSLDFFINKLGFVEQRRHESEKGRFTLVFVACPESPECPVELTYNWDPEVYTGGRNFGHLAIAVDDIYDYCARLMKAGITINRPPRDGRMAFIKTPDGISIEVLQREGSLASAEPWASMPNTGTW
jgi:lactoylglutathione lyase